MDRWRKLQVMHLSGHCFDQDSTTRYRTALRADDVAAGEARATPANQPASEVNACSTDSSNRIVR